MFIELLLWVQLPYLANKNAGCPLKLEFQSNSKQLSSVSMSYAIVEIYQYIPYIWTFKLWTFKDANMRSINIRSEWNCSLLSWVRKIPWRRKWQPIPVFLPEKSHGQRSLVGYSPKGRKESDMTKWLCTHTPSPTADDPSALPSLTSSTSSSQ